MKTSILSKIINLIINEKQEDISMDELEVLLTAIKTKKIHYLTLKNVSVVETKAADGSLRITAIASTNSIDRGDDIVIPQGIKTTNIKNGIIPMFLQHDADLRLGGWDKWYINDKNEFIVEGTVLEPILDWQKEAVQGIKARMLNGISIGFLINDMVLQGDIRVLQEIELLEVSVVSIPMNQDCYITEVQEMKKNVKSDSSVEPVIADAPVATTQENPPSPELGEQNPATSVEPSVVEELAKLKEENDKLKLQVEALQAEVADYETAMTEMDSEVEELMKNKGVL